MRMLMEKESNVCSLQHVAERNSAEQSAEFQGTEASFYLTPAFQAVKTKLLMFKTLSFRFLVSPVSTALKFPFNKRACLFIISNSMPFQPYLGDIRTKCLQCNSLHSAHISFRDASINCTACGHRSTFEEYKVSYFIH